MDRPTSDNDPQQWLVEHGDALFRFALHRTGDRHLAEDLVQDALVRGYRALAQFRGESSIRTWLFQILRNEIHSHFRKQARRPKSKELTEDGIGLEDLLRSNIPNQEFESELEKDEFLAAVKACYEKIPAHLLEPFLLKLKDPEEKIDNLCKELGISPSNFSVRLFRTRLLLRKCLENGWLNDQ